MIVTLTLLMLAQAGQLVGGGQEIREVIACAPMSLSAPPVPAIRVIGGYVHGRIMFGPGEPLVINAGSAQGIQKGQEFFVRRYVRDRFTPASTEFVPNSVHTTGKVTIIDVNENRAIATVSHACDGIIEGDYLEPFVDPVVPTVAPDAMPDFAHPARIVMADERRQTGYPGLVMLMNRGSDDGVRPGQAITIYREAPNNAGPTLMVGEAIVLAVTPKLATVRIEASNDAVYIGDLAAIHRITQ